MGPRRSAKRLDWGRSTNCLVLNRFPEVITTRMWPKMAREENRSGLRAGIGSPSPPRRLVDLPRGKTEFRMNATRSSHELNDQSANRRLPALRSSSVSQSPAGSVDGAYRHGVWLRPGVRPRFCPKCGSAATLRSNRHGALDMLVLLPVRPFRCMDCNWRFYGLTVNLLSIRSWLPFARRSNFY